MQGDQCLDAPCFHTKVNAHIDREIAARPELVQIEDGWRKPSEKRPDAVQRGHFREIDTTTENPDAEPIAACAAAKPALVVYGKRVGTTLTVCTDNNCPVHDPRAASRAAEREAEHPAPVMAPAPPTETEEEAEARKQQHEEQRKAYEAEEERRAEERRKQQERDEQEREAEFAKRDKLRKKREATFERIVTEAPPVFTAPQLRVILRALVNLDPYTFADDLAEDVSRREREAQRRGSSAVRLSKAQATTSSPALPSVSPLQGIGASRAKASSTSSPKPKPLSSPQNQESRSKEGPGAEAAYPHQASQRE